MLVQSGVYVWRGREGGEVHGRIEEDIRKTSAVAWLLFVVGVGDKRNKGGGVAFAPSM